MSNTCPLDQSILVAQANSVPTIYLCQDCRGLWFPTSAVAAVIGQPPRLAVPESQGGRAQAALVCPEDGKSLVRFLVDGVELDICPACEGVWFDRGEVEYLRAKKAGTAPRISESDSGVSHTLAGAVGDATEKLRGIDVAPDVAFVTVELGTRAVGTALANPELVGQITNAVGDTAGNLAPIVAKSAADLAPHIAGAAADLAPMVVESAAGLAPHVVEAAAGLAPHIAEAIVELIVGAFTN